jgi:hypothetical protein
MAEKKLFRAVTVAPAFVEDEVSKFYVDGYDLTHATATLSSTGNGGAAMVVLVLQTARDGTGGNDTGATAPGPDATASAARRIPAMNDQPLTPQEPIANLVFNRDGTLDEAQLAGLPEEVLARVTAPEFVERARRTIREQSRTYERTGRRESRLRPAFFHPATKPIRHAPRPELSGRQLVKARKLVHRLAKAGGIA